MLLIQFANIFRIVVKLCMQVLTVGHRELYAVVSARNVRCVQGVGTPYRKSRHPRQLDVLIYRSYGVGDDVVTT